RRLPRAHRVAADGRDCTYSLATGGDAAPSPGMGARRAVAPDPGPGAFGFLPSHAVGRRVGRGCGASDRDFRANGMAMGRALPGLLAPLAIGCLVDEPSAAGDRRPSHLRGPGARAPPDRTSNLAVLRAVYGPRFPWPALRQF